MVYHQLGTKHLVCAKLKSCQNKIPRLHKLMKYIISFYFQLSQLHSSSSQRLIEMSTGSISRESLMIIRCLSLRPAEEAVVRVSLISDSFLVTWTSGGQWPGWWQAHDYTPCYPEPRPLFDIWPPELISSLSLSYPLHCPWCCFQWAINVIRISEYHLLNEIIFVSQFCFEDISSLLRPRQWRVPALSRN